MKQQEFCDLTVMDDLRSSRSAFKDCKAAKIIDRSKSWFLPSFIEQHRSSSTLTDTLSQRPSRSRRTGFRPAGRFPRLAALAVTMPVRIQVLPSFRNSANISRLSEPKRLGARALHISSAFNAEFPRDIMDVNESYEVKSFKIEPPIKLEVKKEEKVSIKKEDVSIKQEGAFKSWVI